MLCILCLTCSGYAENPATLLSDMDLQYQEQLFEQTRPLLELTVAASMLSGETPEEFESGDDMPSSYASALDQLSGLYGFSSAGSSSFLENNYALSVPDSFSEIALPPHNYTGLFLLELTPSPDQSKFAVTAEVYMAPKPYNELSESEWQQFVWADMMATITLQSDEQADTGWKVTSLHFSSAYFSDDTDEPPVSNVSLLRSYYNEKHGCSISYPALFAEDDIQSDEESMHCVLADGSASIDIRFASSSEASTEAALQTVLGAHPEVTMLSTELSDMLCLEYEDQEMLTRWFCVHDSQTMITVSLSWNPAIHDHFADLADLMMQSMISEENTQG